MVGSKIPIYKGCEKSILQDFYVDGYFGKDGMSGHQQTYIDHFSKDEPDEEQEEHAVDFIINMIKKYPNEVCLIMIGNYIMQVPPQIWQSRKLNAHKSKIW